MTNGTREGVRPRPVWQIVVIGLAVGGWLFLALLHLDLRYGRAALPIILTVRVGGPLGPDDVKLGWQFRRGDFNPPRRGYTMGGGRVWHLRQAWVASLLLAAAPETLDRIETMTVRIGDRAAVLQRDSWQSQWPNWPGGAEFDLPEGWEIRRLSADPDRPSSAWPSFAHVLNYPGEAVLLRRALTHPVFLAFWMCFALVLLYACWTRHRPASRAVLEAVVPIGKSQLPTHGSAGPEANGPGRTAAWWLAGLAVLVGCGILLEAQQPYYFTQDDNYSQFYPGMLYGCRSAFAGGFPAWNPHQLLGAPLAEVGTYALTYPFTYLSYGFARHVLGSELAGMEVFCALHLMGGFAAMFWLGRRLGLAASLCAAMALCFALSGYALIGGRSWYYMTPTFTWAPLLGVSVLSLTRGDPGWRWLLGTGAVIGLYFHAGNAQMWAYAMAFFGLALAWGALAGAIPWIRLLKGLGAIAVGLGAAAFLLVPQFLGIQGMYRVGGGGGNILTGLHALLVPYPLGKADAPADLGTMYLDYFGQLYYAGSVFTLAWLAGLLAAWVYPGRFRALLKNPLFVLGLAAVLLCLGEAGVLWYLQAKLPMFNKFKHPVKLLPLFHLFSLTAGALVVHRLTLRSSSPARWRAACFAVVSVLLVYHAWLAQTSFYSFSDKPYPEMPEAISRFLRRGAEPVRILPVAQSRSTAAGYTLSLGAYFASVYGVDSFTGHDPLVSFRPEYQAVERRADADLLEAIRRHGVTYLLVHSTIDRPVLCANPAVQWQETRNLHVLEPLRSYFAGREPLVEAGDLRLYEVDAADPMAFPAKEPAASLPIVRIPSGVQVDSSGLEQGGDVVINYLWYPGIRIIADGQEIASEADRFGRIRAQVPPGARTLTLRYRGRWLLGFAVGAALIAAGLAWHALLRRLSPGTGHN